MNAQNTTTALTTSIINEYQLFVELEKTGLTARSPNTRQIGHHRLGELFGGGDYGDPHINAAMQEIFANIMRDSRDCPELTLHYLADGLEMVLENVRTVQNAFHDLMRDRHFGKTPGKDGNEAFGEETYLSSDAAGLVGVVLGRPWTSDRVS